VRMGGKIFAVFVNFVKNYEHFLSPPSEKGVFLIIHDQAMCWLGD